MRLTDNIIMLVLLTFCFIASMWMATIWANESSLIYGLLMDCGTGAN